MNDLLLQLSVECPFGKKLPGCPLTGEESSDLECISHGEVEAILSQHRNCLEERLSETLPVFQGMVDNSQAAEMLSGYD